MRQIKNLPLRKQWVIFLTLFVLGLVGVGLSTVFSADVSLGGILSLMMMLLSLVWNIFFLKCPHCGYGFGLRHPVTAYCPGCGEKIS